ncbi:MEDS domain-containing protein [Ramlibacter sp. AN1133]|uniref:MEDS domain-containing protein n=1 Tax=Ramlibacter sp. AN1133 TaxID=3133429 RepID=UPI0030BE15F5
MNSQSPSPEALGEPSARSRHACAFFESYDEEYRTLLPFANECVRCNSRCFHLHNPEQASERANLLLQAGATSDGVAGAQEMRPWEETTVHGGAFNMNDMLALFRELVTSGSVWANMEWALRESTGADDFIEFEARINPVISAHNVFVICTYQAGRHQPAVMLDVLRAHPMIVVEGKVEPNPLYVPTETFLAELRQRRTAAQGG